MFLEPEWAIDSEATRARGIKKKKNTLFVKNRDPMESLGSDDVSPLNSPKYEIVRDDVNRKCPKGSLGLIL